MYCFSTMMYLDTSEYQTNSRGVYKKIITVSPRTPSWSSFVTIHTAYIPQNLVHLMRINNNIVLLL